MKQNYYSHQSILSHTKINNFSIPVNLDHFIELFITAQTHKNNKCSNIYIYIKYRLQSSQSTQSRIGNICCNGKRNVTINDRA